MMCVCVVCVCGGGVAYMGGCVGVSVWVWCVFGTGKTTTVCVCTFGKLAHFCQFVLCSSFLSRLITKLLGCIIKQIFLFQILKCILYSSYQYATNKIRHCSINFQISINAKARLVY